MTLLFLLNFITTAHAITPNNCQAVADRLYKFVDSKGTRDHRSSGVMPDTSKKIDGLPTMTYSSTTKETSNGFYGKEEYTSHSSLTEVYAGQDKLAQISLVNVDTSLAHDDDGKQIPGKLEGYGFRMKIDFNNDCTVKTLKVLEAGKGNRVISLNAPFCAAAVPMIMGSVSKKDGKTDFTKVRAIDQQFKLNNLTGNDSKDYSILMGDVFLNCNMYAQYIMYSPDNSTPVSSPTGGNVPTNIAK